MTILPVTSLFAAASAVALVALSFPISLQRIKVGDMVGDSTDETLHRRIRAQVAIGGGLALGRLLHAIGMLSASGPVRGFGTIFTYLALLIAAGRLFVDVGAW